MVGPHIILRGIIASTRDAFLGPAPSQAADAVGLRVEVETLSQTEVPQIAREPDILAVAPVMPMKLVSPFEDRLTSAATAGPTWGVRAVRADTSPFTGQGITVAVLDTGIDATHPAFRDVQLIQEDFTGEGTGDRDGHGTHCAGTLFGRDVSGIRIGVARGVERALIGKVLGSQGGSSDQIARAIQWAVDQGANVISMSLGLDFPGYVERLVKQGYPIDLATSRALEAYRLNLDLFETLAVAIRARTAWARQATVLVAAAGNESRRDLSPEYELDVSPPAVADGFLSVAALQDGPEGYAVATFSNTGAAVSGPGVKVLSAWPGGGLYVLSGTSMATPHVAGVAALWAEKLQRQGTLNGRTLLASVLSSGRLENLSPGTEPADVGTGMVQAPQG